MGKASDRQLKDRQIFLDVLRVLASAAVVLMHVVSGVADGGYDMTGYERRARAFCALKDGVAWCVPIFLITSGYLMLNPERKVTWRDALLRYCRRIFLALVLFGIPYSLLELVGRERAFRPEMLWQAIWNTATMRSWAHMWYLYLILALYAVTPALKWGLERLPKAGLYGILTCLAFFCSLLPFAEQVWHFDTGISVPREGIYLFYYGMGYVFAVRKKEALKWEGPCCLVAFVVAVALEMACRFMSGSELDMAYAYPPTLLAALLLFDGSRALLWSGGGRALPLAGGRLVAENQGLDHVEKKAQEAVMQEKGWRGLLELSGLSFGIYLIHPVFLNFFYKFMGYSPMNFRFWVGVPLFWAISFLGAAAATFLLCKIPFMKKYVL